VTTPKARLPIVCLLALALLAMPAQVDASPAAQGCQMATLPAFGAQATALNLGCATSQPFQSAASVQPFEHGEMLWLQEWVTISVLAEDGTYASYDDLHRPERIDPPGLTPPAPDLSEPLQGFGEIWHKLGGPTAPIGWATAPEQSYVATVQYFERGAVIRRPDGTILGLAIFNQARGQWANGPAS
jgi:hypothetical protein